MVTESVCGSWLSPLSSKLACDSSISIKRLYVDASNPELLYWSELHPSENGRTIVFSKNVNDPTSEPKCWTPEGYSVADTVHEYGGAAFFVANGTIYFMNYVNEDNKIYSQTANEPQPKAVTHGPENYYRYADGEFLKHSNFFFCVREDHSMVKKDDKDSEAENTIVCINATTGDETKIAFGSDFYSFPRVSPDGSKLAWMTWKHPNMPWDDTEIWVADITVNGDSVNVSNKRKIADETEVNFMEPQWTCDNKLMYISDKSNNWWNLYIVDNLHTGESRNIFQLEKEIGEPCWDFGYRSYSPHPTNKDLVAVLYGHKPSLLTISTGVLQAIGIDSNYFVHSCVFEPVEGKHLYMHINSPIEPEFIYRYDCGTEQLHKLHDSAPPVVDGGYLSVPTAVEFPVDKDKPEPKTAYGYYYKPQNKDFKPPDGTLPPLLIKIHGGPTGAASMALDLGKQYFTSRGIAILDVNYRGSAEYGTAFRKALRRNWGVHDIEDACAGALYMAEDKQLADRCKLLIDGGSAGGYTTLACLTFRPEVFAAGASHYGIGDLVTLAENTHKFESQYCDKMVAEYPKEKYIYEQRSPINYTADFKTPCAFFQGQLDKVVPPKQSSDMFNAIDANKVPCAYVLFPDEAHGFEKSENKQKALDGEFYFYSQILRFEAADPDIEIQINNLP